jgi:hypothetical protein
MGKKSRSGSGMNIQDHISGSSETIFWVKSYLISLMRIRIRELFDPGSGMEKLGSGIKTQDPEHMEIYEKSGQYKRGFFATVYLW